MKYKLKVYNIWECGQRVDSNGNPHQEDSIYPAYGQQKDTDRLFILCDGMGGHEAGEVASSTVCSAMSKSIFESVPDAEGDFSDENLLKAIEDAFNALDALSTGDVSSEKKMGTTMTFLKFHNKGCTIAHMGDSRVYHIRPGKGREDTRILFKTEDHSLVNDLIKVGELTPEEAKQSKQKNIITRAMQPQMERRPKSDIYHTSDIKKGDYFYMCSDGMLEQMEDENLLFNFSEATGDDENKVQILTQATSQNSDNHSAIFIHVLDVIDSLPIEAPSSVLVNNKPEPIMAEIGEDLPSNETISDNRNRMNADSLKSGKSGNKGFLKNLLLAIVFILLAFGIYIVASKLQEDIVAEPEETENPQPSESVNKDDAQYTKQSQKSSSSSRRSSHKSNKEVQSDKSVVVSSSASDKQQDVLSKENKQNAETNPSVPQNKSQGTNENDQKTPHSATNVNSSNSAGENAASSDVPKVKETDDKKE